MSTWKLIFFFFGYCYCVYGLIKALRLSNLMTEFQNKNARKPTSSRFLWASIFRCVCFVACFSCGFVPFHNRFLWPKFSIEKFKQTNLEIGERIAKLFLLLSVKIDSDLMRVCKTRRVFVMKSHLFLYIQLRYRDISNIIMFWSSVGCKHKKVDGVIYTAAHDSVLCMTTYRSGMKRMKHQCEKKRERENE